jgi:SAM-dependent methyltransferase
MTAHGAATTMSPIISAAKSGEGFRWYRDERLTNTTPYHSDNHYFRKAKDRMDRTVGLIQEALPGSTVVDVGASPFYLLYRALELGAKKGYGIYFANDDHPLRAISTIHSAVGSVDLLHKDIESDHLPFADNSVDVLTACEVLEHLEYFPFRFVHEVRRVVRPGGLVCFTVPNAASIGNILKLVFQKNIFMKYRSDPTGRHKHEYTLAELKAFFGFLGFDLVRCGVMPSPTSEKMWLRPAYRLIARIPGLRRYSPVLYVVGRQPAAKKNELPELPPALLYSEDLSVEL